jgi:hypothetical protein
MTYPDGRSRPSGNVIRIAFVPPPDVVRYGPCHGCPPPAHSRRRKRAEFLHRLSRTRQFRRAILQATAPVVCANRLHALQVVPARNEYARSDSVRVLDKRDRCNPQCRLWPGRRQTTVRVIFGRTQAQVSFRSTPALNIDVRRQPLASAARFTAILAINGGDDSAPLNLAFEGRPPCRARIFRGRKEAPAHKLRYVANSHDFTRNHFTRHQNLKSARVINPDVSADCFRSS